MSPPNRIASFPRALAAVLLASLVLAPTAQALRVVDYNLLNYPGNTLATRQPLYRTILAPLGADVVIAEEMTSQAGVDSFVTNVLNVIEPGQWVAAPFVNGNDTDNALFYKPSKVQFLGRWSFYPNPANLLRLVGVYRLLPVGYGSSAAELRIYACHLKASTGYESQRLAEAAGIRDSMNAMPPGTHAILTGDFNFYSGAEPGFLEFKASQANNIGQLYDALNAPASTWNSSGLAAIHTQSPCNGSGCASGAATGGLDDRFDLFLLTNNLNSTEGLGLIPGSYVPVGNDGKHYNMGITEGAVLPEGAAYAGALLGASDHLPIRLDLQLPARVQVATSLDFGTRIVGAAAEQTLTVTDVALPPADELTYSYAAPAGFTAPAGTLSATTSSPAADVIGMSTASSGVKSGTLVLDTDDPDHPTVNVALGGTVLEHATASLDSLATRLADTLALAPEAEGGLLSARVAVHNPGYDALHARLLVGGAVVTGGDGRFTLESFAPALVSDVAARWTVSFVATGATPGETYEATLDFACADEPLPGATARPDLVVVLRATPASPLAVGGDHAPAATRLYSPQPNPALAGSVLRFDLATAATARLEVFDLGGRRVASLLGDGALEPGRYSIRWDGPRGQGGAGLYFVRLSGPGMHPQTARLVMVR